MSGVTVDGTRARVRFDSYDREAYELFLRAKALPESELSHDWRDDSYELSAPARFAAALGGVAPDAVGADLPLAEHLFDYQRFIVEQALSAGRYAIWADTGLGKTAMFLEWARQVKARTGGGVLILSPLQVIEQTRDEWERFYGRQEIDRLDSRDELTDWCCSAGAAIAITNYEKLAAGVLNELRLCAGLACDESSILKSGGGTIKWNLIKSARGIENKLSCTATPAPNDTMEYASQASFLEKLRTEGDILWTFFSRDKRGTWRVKPHAREAFYRFMASWSIYLRDPARFGFADILSTLPPPNIVEHRIELTSEQRAAMQEYLAHNGRGLFDERLGVRERSKLSQLAKGFTYGEGEPVRIPSLKPAKVCELVRAERDAGRQVLVWTVFDEESEILAELLCDPAVGCLHGKLKQAERLELLERFRTGEIEVLISKAQLVGYGLNFQHCRAMVFSGFDDSFERMYQAIRRCYRFGQTETVHVHVPVVPELEGLMLDNLHRKQEQFESDVETQERNYVEALGSALPVAA
jgi:hypothetical protein